MLPEDSLLQLVLFTAGQAAAWYYLRTGRWWVGVCASGAMWVLADWFFVAKHVFGASGSDLTLPLVALQSTAILTIVGLLFALWRRRWSATAKSRPQLFGQGLAAHLRGDHEAARQIFRRLARNDPWDAAAWVAWGNVESRTGTTSRARRCYRRALGVDTRVQYTDLIQHQLERLSPTRQSAEARSAAVAPAAAHPVT